MDPITEEVLKNNKSGRIVKVSFYAEYLCILIKNAENNKNIYYYLYIFIILFKSTLRKPLFHNQTKRQKIPKLVKLLLGDPFVCTEYVHFT